MNFTALGHICLLRHLPPSEVAHSTILTLSLLNTQIGNEFYCPCPFFSPQHHPVLTHPRCSYCLSSLQPYKGGENQFYSTLYPIKWHTSHFSCFLPFYLLKNVGPKSISGLCFHFIATGFFLKERHTSSFCFCTAASSESLTKHQHTGGVFCLHLSHTSVYCPCARFEQIVVKGLRVLKGHLR